MLEPRDAFDVVRREAVNAARRPRPAAGIHEHHVIEASPLAHERGGFAAALAHLEGAMVSADQPPRDGPAGAVVARVRIADADQEAA